ncbi:MAG TPA: glycoside hydrolase family 15 protein [Candidatus Limnocylindrales bacterium]|nr:glycoside hydrolase family 15 protein [Candidatus Limnocylindrales bacterium]
MKKLSIPVIALVFSALIYSPALFCQNAPGAPGDMPTWTAGSKEGVGTSTTLNSKVWFTLGGGILTEVYYPRVDTPDVRSLEFAVSDGHRVWIESSDLQHSIQWIDHHALLYRQISRDPRGKFTITKTYATDPARNTLLVDVTFSGPAGDSLYVLYHPALDNSGYGETGATMGQSLVAEKQNVATALLCSAGFARMSSGFQGTSDGYTDLLLHHHLAWTYTRAEQGNVIQVARVISPKQFTLALGFGSSPQAAIEAARASLREGFSAIRTAYSHGWSAYGRGLKTVAQPYEPEFRLAAMVIRAHEDKTFRGAIIASLSVPWGFAAPANTPAVGGYHLVWARDLYEAASTLLAAGKRAAAERSLAYLFNVQQKPDGSFPQNTWVDGRPYWTSAQMDEDSYPMILAWQLGKNDRDTWEKHIRPEAEYVVAHGPATLEERWEELPGYSPSTMAAEIAGLVCAADIARKNGATEDAKRYLSTADDWSAHLEKWLVTTTGHLGGPVISKEGYYIRIGDSKNPNDGYRLDTRNGSGTWPESDVVDAGFLELVRLGIRPADNPTIERSLKVIDSTIRVETPNGPSFRRYNHDGYGETYFGGPWQGQGIGRLWPVFTGERGEYEVALGQDATPYLQAMLHFANAGGMIPEQVWDRADPTKYHFVFGQGTGSATPLVWSMAQFMRLALCVQEKRIVEQPSVVAAHFLKGKRLSTHAAASTK